METTDYTKSKSLFFVVQAARLFNIPVRNIDKYASKPLHIGIEFHEPLTSVHKVVPAPNHSTYEPEYLLGQESDAPSFIRSLLVVFAIFAIFTIFTIFAITAITVIVARYCICGE